LALCGGRGGRGGRGGGQSCASRIYFAAT